MSHSTRTKVHCYCKKCGGKLVDPRTRDSHRLKHKYADNYQETGPSNAEPSYANKNYNYQQEAEPSNIGLSLPHAIGNNDSLPGNTDSLPEIIEPLFENNFSFLIKKMSIHESAKSQNIKKGKISNQALVNLLSNDDMDEDDDDYIDSDDADDDGIDSEDDYDENGNSEDFDDEDDRDSEDKDENEEVNFASTGLDYDEPNLPNINVNCNYTWIILWILQYQQRYKLANIAVNSLFKFFKFFLLTIDEKKFSSFPSSLYMAKKTIGLSTKIIKYAACNKCHKLYDINEISNEASVPTCSFINYPNHSIERFRQKCNNPLFKKIDSNDSNSQIFRPIMTFPLVNIKQQLTLFFGRKNFEMSCRKWAERKNETEALFDIYDGMIWKDFRDENMEPFFTKEFADTHIGLMLNMDWFQPYINSQYSVGVIYAVICNLPRSERFKPYNILTLAVLPGPKEPSLHEINNYLYPIVNQLNRLWNGYFTKTHEYSNGRFIRGAVIGCSCDVPASRKLCGFISARIACYRCHKSANFVNNQPNFGGFENFDKWFIERDINIIREKASEWKRCPTEESRKAHVSQHHVRWSEMYRLLYFNPVRSCVVDPMHCLFLGVAKWIITKLWISEGVLDNAKLKVMQKRADMIKFPSDLGRRPIRIATGEGFSNFTADMWKTFILIFAIPITWDFLGAIDQKILTYFVRACKILTNRELQKNELDEAFTRLLEMNKLIEQKYGQDKISPNLHLCLHICECALDYGPLSSFWCFSFERMNGILGKLII